MTRKTVERGISYCGQLNWIKSANQNSRNVNMEDPFSFSIKTRIPLQKIVIPTDDLNEAFHHAINDLKTHVSRYLKTFGQD